MSGVTRTLTLITGILWIFFLVMHLITDSRRPSIVTHDDGVYIQFNGKDYAKITSVEIVEEKP